MAVQLRGIIGRTVSEAPYRGLLPLLQVVNKSCFTINSVSSHTSGVLDASRDDRGTQRESAVFEPLDRRTERLLHHGE